jgi:hypothetical protein
MRGLGGAAVVASLAAGFMLSGGHQASAEEVVSPGLESVPIFDGPALLPPPNDFGPAQPPREGLPNSQPTPSPTETPIYNADPQPTTPPLQAPREEPRPVSDSQQPQNYPSPATEVAQPAESTTKPAVEAPTIEPPTSETASVVAKPVLMSSPLITVSAPMPTGSTTITPAARISLAKTAATVKTSSRSVSIAVTTTGTTVSKATAQANVMVAQLKKNGVAAVTVIKRVGNKTSVSVLVTKKP